MIQMRRKQLNSGWANSIRLSISVFLFLLYIPAKSGWAFAQLAHPFTVPLLHVGTYCQDAITIKGAFINYVDRILPFLTPLSLPGQFLYPERGQKQTFFDPLPPSSCPRSY